MGFSLRIHGMAQESIVDGPGLRYAIFTQGCMHACPGCHNPGSHDPDGGTLEDTDRILARIAENPLLAGVTFSGGEPFLQAEALCHIAEGVRRMGKTVTVFTGYTLEQLCQMAATAGHVGKLLALTDLLIDGPYVESQRNLELLYRGSANQRILDSWDIREMMDVYGVGSLDEDISMAG